jgi:hypothetical protein
MSHSETWRCRKQPRKIREGMHFAQRVQGGQDTIQNSEIVTTFGHLNMTVTK